MRPVHEARLIRVPRFETAGVRLMPTDRAANATSADLSAAPIDIELLVLEQFPPELRARFNDAIVKLNCLAFVEHYNWAIRTGHGAARTISRINELERNETAVLAGRYLAQYKMPLPHVGAGASVQRYGPLGLSRHPARRYGKPVMRARSKRRRQVRKVGSARF